MWAHAESNPIKCYLSVKGHVLPLLQSQNIVVLLRGRTKLLSYLYNHRSEVSLDVHVFIIY